MTLEHESHHWVLLELLDLLLRPRLVNWLRIIILASLWHWASVAHAVVEWWFVCVRITFHLASMLWKASLELLELEDLKWELLVNLGLLVLSIHLLLGSKRNALWQLLCQILNDELVKIGIWAAWRWLIMSLLHEFLGWWKAKWAQVNWRLSRSESWGCWHFIHEFLFRMLRNLLCVDVIAIHKCHFLGVHFDRVSFVFWNCFKF